MATAEKRSSTSGYDPASMATTGYVPCVERHLYAAGPSTGSSKDSDTVLRMGVDDIGIVPDKKNDKSEAEKPNDFIELSIVACVFNFIFAIVAMTLSYKSQDSWKLGDRTRAKAYGLVSMAMSVFAIVTTAIIVFVIVWLYALGGIPASSL